MLRDIIEKLKSGTFFRLSYKTDCPVKAMYKKNGVKVVKIVETTVRTGVNYRNIKEVIEATEERTSDRNYVNPYSWVISNKIKHHNEKNEDYLVVATAKKHNTESQYLISINGIDDIISKEELIEQGYLIDSYWNNNKPHSCVRTIKFSNILAVNGKRV